MDDTIVALATPPGVGAIGVIRLSGNKALKISNTIFRGKNIEKADSHTIHFGTIRDENNEIIDEVLVSVFVAPKSFTKENAVEISTHGSMFIIQRIIQLLIKNGARSAQPGEFTMRAFMNGQFDLAQAEAVADLIHSDSEAAHKAAMDQMRGGFSKEIQALRDKLIHFASMIELELDFGEEDVEFADRDDLRLLIEELLTVIKSLVQSFSLGNVIKEGIPTVIVGKPNAGKSTLLNALLNEEKAIVSSIPGTTRDYIEDEINIEGIKFRFIDTAGLRETTDEVEAIGVERTREQITKSSLVILLFDAPSVLANQKELDEIKTQIEELKNSARPYLLVANKIDQIKGPYNLTAIDENVLAISASNKENLEILKRELMKAVNIEGFKTGNVMVTNSRHFEGLVRTQESLESVIIGLSEGVTGDFLAMDIRHALHQLGEISGTITSEDLLENIFSRFCIGK